MCRVTLKKKYCSSQKQRCSFRFAVFFFILRFGARARDDVSTTTTLITCTRGGIPLLFYCFLSESTSSLTITA